MCICLPFPWMCSECLNRIGGCTTYVLLSRDSWCHDIHSIWHPFSGFVMESYSALEMTAVSAEILGEAYHLYAEHYPQHSIPSHKLSNQTSPMTANLGLLLHGTGLWKASISPNSWYGSLRAEKSGRTPQNQHAKNCSCWRYQCSPYLENSPWAIALSTQHPADASPYSSWQSCKGSVLRVTSHKMLCKYIVCCKHHGSFQNTHISVDDTTHTTVA
jgi:hypothetical protein